MEESVWFQKGQEVEELISISLDPNITIHESEQYVTIKGSLELYGEYQRDENDLDTTESEPFSNPKFVQTVEVREEGVSFFTHHFPVEITIPKSRIHDLEQIDVAVETFDYAFPERSCLRLSADLMITGLYGEQQHEFFQEQEDEFIEEPDDEWVLRTEESDQAKDWEEESPGFTEITLEEVVNERQTENEEIAEEEQEDIYEPFAVEARKEAEETVKENEVFQPQAGKKDDFVAFERENEETEEQPVVEEDESRITEVPDITFHAKQGEEDDTGQRKEQEDSFEIKPSYQNDVEEAEETEQSVEEEEPAEAEEKEPVKGKKKKWKKKQTLSITEFLARKEETADTQAKLKVCIVQKGETIDLLSDRYDVSVTQLQRVNNLDINQDVYEGQVLYIPVVQKQK